MIWFQFRKTVPFRYMDGTDLRKSPQMSYILCRLKIESKSEAVLDQRFGRLLISFKLVTMEEGPGTSKSKKEKHAFSYVLVKPLKHF